MAARPLVTVYDGITGEADNMTIKLPSVFLAPIRGDVVHFVFRNQNKNARQPEAVSVEAGKQHAAISWGTGRAVSRIPRITGSGSGRNGQGAFGNMCRKGHMFSPLKVWRKWQRRTPKQLRRYAVASCIAATGVPALVTARGHHIAQIPQVPLVVSNKSINVVRKTKQAVYLLKKIHAYTDVLKVIASKTARAGKGKMRGRKDKLRKGPLVVYGSDNVEAVRAFRNIPGVETCSVDRLSVLKLAPGGHMGRFVIWTESAFKRLGSLFGSFKKTSTIKAGFSVSRAHMAVPDMKRVLLAAQRSGLLRAKKTPAAAVPRRNPLRNWAAMVKLNPYAAIAKKKMAQLAQHKAAQKKQFAEKQAKIDAAYKEAMKESLKLKITKVKRVDGKVQRVAVPNNLVKPVVQHSEKQKAYLKKVAGIKKAAQKEFAKKIDF